MNEQEIIIAKVCSIYDKPYFIKKKNGELKKYLKCCGLGKYYDENQDYFEPYWYNGTWENPRSEYNLFVGLDNVFSSLLIERNTRDLSLLVIELGKNINPAVIFKVNESEEYQNYLTELQRLYQLLGYDLIANPENFDVAPFGGDQTKIADLYGLEQWLYNKYTEVYNSYEGAVDAYTSSNYGTCIEACRTTLTGVFSKYKGTDSFSKWFRGTADIADELEENNMQHIKDHLDALGKKDLAEFFEENSSGSYKKTRAIYSIYSMLSDYGTHRQEGSIEIPSKEDALMMLRMTEDVLIWIYQKKR